MTKQEHIEEMISAMAASNNPFVDVPIEIMPKVAEALYNAGYRKLPVGAVVLLIGENNQALDEKTIEYFVKHNEQIRKEAVKEFAERLKKRTILYSGINVKYEAITADIIDGLLKEYIDEE